VGGGGWIKLYPPNLKQKKGSCAGDISNSLALISTIKLHDKLALPHVAQAMDIQTWISNPYFQFIRFMSDFCAYVRLCWQKNEF
jgi:hypothetical protein